MDSENSMTNDIVPRPRKFPLSVLFAGLIWLGCGASYAAIGLVDATLNGVKNFNEIGKGVAPEKLMIVLGIAAVYFIASYKTLSRTYTSTALSRAGAASMIFSIFNSACCSCLTFYSPIFFFFLFGLNFGSFVAGILAYRGAEYYHRWQRSRITNSSEE